MRMILAALVFAVYVFPISAQPQLDEGRKARAFEMLTQQRNQAMDGLAICVGEYQHQLEQLHKELEQAKQACKPAEK